MLESGNATKVEGEFSIYSAAALKQTLLAALADAPMLDLDLSEVTEIDAAGLQLLLLLKREADRLGRPLRLSGSNARVDEVLELGNLSSLFPRAAGLA